MNFNFFNQLSNSMLNFNQLVNNVTGLIQQEMGNRQSRIQATPNGSRAQDSINLSKLPKEILRFVLELLDKKSLLNMRPVCKSLMNVVNLHSNYCNELIVSAINVKISSEARKLWSSIGHANKEKTNTFIRESSHSSHRSLDQEVTVLNSELDEKTKNIILNSAFSCIYDHCVFYIHEGKIKKKSLLEVNQPESTIDLPCEIDKIRLFFPRNNEIFLVTRTQIFCYDSSDFNKNSKFDVATVEGFDLPILKQDNLLIFDGVIFDLEKKRSWERFICFSQGFEAKISNHCVVALNSNSKLDLYSLIYDVKKDSWNTDMDIEKSIDLTDKKYNNEQDKEYDVKDNKWILEDFEGNTILLRKEKTNDILLVDKNGTVIQKYNRQLKRDANYKIGLFKHQIFETYRDGQGKNILILRDFYNNNNEIKAVLKTQHNMEDCKISSDGRKLTVLFNNTKKTLQGPNDQDSICHYEQYTLST